MVATGFPASRGRLLAYLNDTSGDKVILAWGLFMSNKRNLGGKRFFEMLGAMDAKEGNSHRRAINLSRRYSEGIERVRKGMPTLWGQLAYDKGYINQCVSQELSQ